jgi:hypothetical protein
MGGGAERLTLAVTHNSGGVSDHAAVSSFRASGASPSASPTFEFVASPSRAGVTWGIGVRV